MDFEQKSQKLQKIIEQLENNQVSLEQATKLYEEGVLLAKECYKLLSQSKGKVTILKDELNNLSQDYETDDE